MYKIKLSEIDKLFSAIKEKAKLYIPVSDGKGAKYKLYEQGDKLAEELNTLRSAKDFFFPQTENIVEFKVEGQKIEIIDNRTETEDYVVFGVRACDVRSFDILDSVFLAEPIDSYYKNRREHGVIISLACTNPENTCFCGSFDIDATKPQGDVRAYKTQENLYLEPLTDKGSALLESVKALLSESDNIEVENQIAETKKKLSEIPLSNLQPKDFTKEQLDAFNSPKWAELSKACLGCGACTFVCPTCQCYDIKEFNTGHGIKRYRCWDSCMYNDFTMMAHGTPRYTQMQRFRQRFMHKLVYYPKNNNGVYGCVGCGRCLKKCPISMNIVKVMKSLGEEK